MRPVISRELLSAKYQQNRSGARFGIRFLVGRGHDFLFALALRTPDTTDKKESDRDNVVHMSLETEIESAKKTGYGGEQWLDLLMSMKYVRDHKEPPPYFPANARNAIARRLWHFVREDYPRRSNRMAEQLEIKNAEPSLRRMAADYHLMFSGVGLKITLMFCVLVAVLLAGWFVTPSTTDPNVNIVLRVLAFLDGYFLFGFGAMLVLWLASPLLARFTLPLVIMLDDYTT